MTPSVMGSVINIHALGATVRLDDGRLAAVPLADLRAHATNYQRSLTAKRKLPFQVRDDGRGRSATLVLADITEPELVPTAAPIPLSDDVFEERLADYLRETEVWAPPDQPQPFERHLTSKRRRAAHFQPEE